jgi:hypothetical protein
VRGCEDRRAHRSTDGESADSEDDTTPTLVAVRIEHRALQHLWRHSYRGAYLWRAYIGTL